jgi:hypothetical protein
MTASDDGSGGKLSTKHTLFVVPRGQDEGFRASVRGRILDLGDPSSYALAPTTDDLLIVSFAAALAWSARSFLRAHRLPEYVSVSAEWRPHEDPPNLADIKLTVEVSKRAEELSDALIAVLEDTIAARAHAEPVVHVSLEA